MLTNLEKIADMLIIYSLSIIYICMLPWLGYFLSTILIMPAMFFIFGMKKKVNIVLSTVVIAVLFQLVFFELLGIYLPESELSYWLSQR